MDYSDYTQAGIDYAQGLDRFAGNAAIYEKFLRQFVGDPTFPALEAAMKDGDTAAAFQAAHTLKGLTGNLSLNSLYGRLVKLVEALRGQGNLPLAQALFPAAQEEYRRAVDFIRTRLG